MGLSVIVDIFCWSIVLLYTRGVPEKKAKRFQGFFCHCSKLTDILRQASLSAIYR